MNFFPERQHPPANSDLKGLVDRPTGQSNIITASRGSALRSGVQTLVWGSTPPDGTRRTLDLGGFRTNDPS